MAKLDRLIVVRAYTSRLYIVHAAIRARATTSSLKSFSLSGDARNWTILWSGSCLASFSSCNFSTILFPLICFPDRPNFKNDSIADKFYLVGCVQLIHQFESILRDTDWISFFKTPISDSTMQDISSKCDFGFTYCRLKRSGITERFSFLIENAFDASAVT